MHDTVLQVSDFIALVNQTLEFAYPQVVVEGEVSSFKVSKGKFVFFDLKDQEGTINCFMMAFSLRTPIEDGMHVRVVARPKLTDWGRFSITVQDVNPVGEGSLKKAYELLKAKLAKEGLFDVERKRALPEIPKRVAVISSDQAAGWGDFKKILSKRWGGVEVEFADVAVQGQSAMGEIIAAIEHFNNQAELPEVLVIVRGGGSLDDLQTFNTEPVARAIASSRIPTLIGVGHEQDVTLSGLAADVRASTPSNAAELLVPDKKEYKQRLTGLEQHMADALSRRVEDIRQVLDRFKTAEIINVWVDSLKSQVGQLDATLKAYNPEMVLKKGYSIARTKQGIVAKASDVKVGDELMIQLHQGKLETEVKNVTK